MNAVTCIFYHTYKEPLWDEMEFGIFDDGSMPTVEMPYREYHDIYVPKYPQVLTNMDVNWPYLRKP